MEKYIGCSGYYYNHWKGLFYPEGLPKKKWLIFYSEHFNTVELNNTFYRMPTESAMRNWHDITPAGFIFAVKGNRYITHQKKLVYDNDLKRMLNLFQRTTGLLKEKAGPILWQLPASQGVNIEKLEKFCSILSSDFRHVFEFRNASWFSPEVYDVLARNKHALCIVSSPASSPGIINTSTDFTYIRFHGQGSWYADNYSDESLVGWKKTLVKTGTKCLYAYFNNDIKGYAVNNGKFFAGLF